MHALRYILAGLALVAAAFGQSSKLRDINKHIPYTLPQNEVGADAIIMPKVYAQSVDRIEDRNRELERVFSPQRRGSISVVVESDHPSPRHSIEESPIAEFAMAGAQDIKRLKGGFTLKNPFGGPDIDAYLKSGIAWHPSHDKYLTYTIGRRISRSYAFRDERDLGSYMVKKPIERFNARIEKSVGKLLDTVGF